MDSHYEERNAIEATFQKFPKLSWDLVFSWVSIEYYFAFFLELPRFSNIFNEVYEHCMTDWRLSPIGRMTGIIRIGETKSKTHQTTSLMGSAIIHFWTWERNFPRVVTTQVDLCKHISSVIKHEFVEFWKKSWQNFEFKYFWTYQSRSDHVAVSLQRAQINI